MSGEESAPSGMRASGGQVRVRDVFGAERVMEIQRARLVSAMVKVASEHGFVGATVARVVACAGVSRRTFYELFDDREDCFLAAFDEQVARASRFVLDAYDPSAKWVERLRTVLTSLLVCLDEGPGLAQLLIVGSLGAGPRALERRRRVLAQMITLVDEGRNVVKAGASLPPLTAEGVVGGALSIVHTRVVEGGARPLVDLTGPLMSMFVLPYLGPAAARREYERPVARPRVSAPRHGGDPLRELDMRLTYRTVRVLMAVAAHPGCSNREVGEGAGMTDQGQTSKLLGRLERLGLIHNDGGPPGQGGPNAWTLTNKGLNVEQAMNGKDRGRSVA